MLVILAQTWTNGEFFFKYQWLPKISKMVNFLTFIAFAFDTFVLHWVSKHHNAILKHVCIIPKTDFVWRWFEHNRLDHNKLFHVWSWVVSWEGTQNNRYLYMFRITYMSSKFPVLWHLGVTGLVFQIKPITQIIQQAHHGKKMQKYRKNTPK